MKLQRLPIIPIKDKLFCLGTFKYKSFVCIAKVRISHHQLFIFLTETEKIAAEADKLSNKAESWWDFRKQYLN